MKCAAVMSILAAFILPGCTEKGSSTMLFEVHSQQQIQNALITYLRRTLATLPPGTAIDASRFAGAGHNSPCEDDSGADAPMRFHTIGELKAPSGTDAVTAVGDVWRSWGWHVVERDGFRRPNRFGYSPDGYRLQIITAPDGHPPTVQASSPCFPRLSARDDIPFPVTVTTD